MRIDIHFGTSILEEEMNMNFASGVAFAIAFAATTFVTIPARADNKVCYVFPGMMATTDARSGVDAVSNAVQSKGCKAGDSLVFRHGGADDIIHTVAASKCDLSKSVILTAVGGAAILTCSIAP